MSAIGPGDWVECIGGERGERDGPLDRPARIEGRDVIAGCVYQAREIVIGNYSDGTRGEGVRLYGTRGYNASGIEGAWPITMFRPIYRPSQSLLRDLMTPIPAELEHV